MALEFGGSLPENQNESDQIQNAVLGNYANQATGNEQSNQLPCSNVSVDYAGENLILSSSTFLHDPISPSHNAGGVSIEEFSQSSIRSNGPIPANTSSVFYKIDLKDMVDFEKSKKTDRATKIEYSNGEKLTFLIPKGAPDSGLCNFQLVGNTEETYCSDLYEIRENSATGPVVNSKPYQVMNNNRNICLDNLLLRKLRDSNLESDCEDDRTHGIISMTKFPSYQTVQVRTRIREAIKIYKLNEPILYMSLEYNRDDIRQCGLMNSQMIRMTDEIRPWIFDDDDRYEFKLQTTIPQEWQDYVLNGSVYLEIRLIQVDSSPLSFSFIVSNTKSVQTLSIPVEDINTIKTVTIELDNPEELRRICNASMIYLQPNVSSNATSGSQTTAPEQHTLSIHSRLLWIIDAEKSGDDHPQNIPPTIFGPFNLVFDAVVSVAPTEKLVDPDTMDIATLLSMDPMLL